MVDLAGLVLARQLGLDPNRLIRVRAGELADGAVERGGEEHRLAVVGDAAQDLVDLRLEAHVEHPVGLVEDEDRDGVERDEAAVHQVLQPARRGDEHVGLLGLRGLRREGDAAVDGGDLEPARLAELGEDFGHLNRELARRHEHEGGMAVRRPATMRSTIGIANASVLPEPVGALARTSWPASAAGIARVWIWKGDSMPCAVSTPDDVRAQPDRGKG